MNIEEFHTGSAKSLITIIDDNTSGCLKKSFGKSNKSYKKKGSENMSCDKTPHVDNEVYSTTLRSYDKYLQSSVEVKCKNFETFSKIVTAVNKILDEEVQNFK